MPNRVLLWISQEIPAGLSWGILRKKKHNEFIQPYLSFFQEFFFCIFSKSRDNSSFLKCFMENPKKKTSGDISERNFFKETSDRIHEVQDQSQKELLRNLLRNWRVLGNNSLRILGNLWKNVCCILNTYNMIIGIIKGRSVLLWKWLIEQTCHSWEAGFVLVERYTRKKKKILPETLKTFFLFLNNHVGGYVNYAITTRADGYCTHRWNNEPWWFRGSTHLVPCVSYVYAWQSTAISTPVQVLVSVGRHRRPRHHNAQGKKSHKLRSRKPAYPSDVESGRAGTASHKN